jgi:hypothetical protein
MYGERIGSSSITWAICRPHIEASAFRVLLRMKDGSVGTVVKDKLRLQPTALWVVITFLYVSFRQRCISRQPDS